MDKQRTLKANIVLCLVTVICSFLPVSFPCHILLQMVLILICYICHFVIRASWKKEYSNFLKEKGDFKQKSRWKTGNKKVDDLYVSCIYWLVTSLLIPFCGILWVARGLNS